MAVSSRQLSSRSHCQHIKCFEELLQQNQSGNRSSSTVVAPCAHTLAEQQCNNLDSSCSWVVLSSPSTPPEEISILRQKVKYLAVLPNMEGAVVLIDDGRGILQPQNAFYVAENVIFVFDGSVHTAKSIRLILYRNPVMIFTSSGEGIIFSTVDITSFLYSVGENVIMKKMLQVDGCYSIVDRYALAMAFIYLKRATVSDYLFTNILSVLGSLLLAHKMEEDEAPGRNLLQLIYSCLPRGISEVEKLDFISSIVSFQTNLFRKISYRGYVQVEECEEVISVLPKHPIWKRWRLSFHGGAVRDTHQVWKLNFIYSSGASCSSAPGATGKSTTKCIMCKGNAHYSQTVQDRFTLQTNFSTQQIHLSNVLSAVTEAHTTNLKVAVRCSLELGLSFHNWPKSFIIFLKCEDTWPAEYVSLLEIENRIENVLADEKYLQKNLAMLQMKKKFPSLYVDTSATQFMIM